MIIIMLFIVTGEADLETESTNGQSRTVKAGDVVHWEKGSMVKWTEVRQRLKCEIVSS